MCPLKRIMTIGFALLLSFSDTKAQKRVLSLPFEFEKSFLEAGDYDAYFLNNDKDSSFSLVLKDNKKVQYVLVDQKFHVVSRIDTDLKSSVFNEDIVDYRGGTTSGNMNYFIYEEKEKKAFSRPVTQFQLETVDFNAKKVTHAKLFEIPKSEKVISSFSENNTYFTFTVDDKSKELVLYKVNEAGSFQSKRFPFTVPATAGKSRNSLSEYFANLRVIKTNQESELSSASSSAKLFIQDQRLQFVINDKQNPVHLFSITLPDLLVKEQFIDFSSFESKKDDIAVNSFFWKNRIYSLILDKKTIRVAVHEEGSGSLLSKYEFADESSFGLFAEQPVTVSRTGSKVKENDLASIKSVIKALEKGKEGIMVSENARGQIIVTVGTYDMIAQNSGGSSGSWQGGYERSSVAVQPDIMNHGATVGSTMVYNSHMYYRPGSPSFTSYSARYYTSTHFKFVLDPSASKLDRGKVSTPIADQVNDYIETIDKKAKATNQFSIGERQFYGYYDRDSKSYIVDEIRMRR